MKIRALRTAALACAAGVSPDTLRHYELKGLLPAPSRSANGYREYPPEALARVRLVRRAVVLGFTLDELARIVKTRDQGGAPCAEVRALGAAKLDLMIGSGAIRACGPPGFTGRSASRATAPDTRW